MKYSLLLPLDTGFIFVEGKPPRRPASVKVSTQQNIGRLAGKGLGERWRNATGAGLRGVTVREKKKGVGEINMENKRVFAQWSGS